MTINKLCFAYPIIYKEGMTKEESCVPAPLITNVAAGSTNTVVVNVGMMIYLIEPISIRVEIHPFGQDADKSPNLEDGRMEHLVTNILPFSQGIFLSSLYVENVLFSDTGLYEITVKLLKNTDDGADEVLVDKLNSYFYVLTRTDL